MGKKNIYDLSTVDPIKAVSQHVNKNGKLTGDKKEKKALRSICEHHVISKKGKKIKAQLDIHGKQCTCKVCRETMPVDFYDDQQYDKVYAPFKAILSQGKLMAAATNADLKTQQEICELNLRADNYKKVYGNLRKVTEKQDKIKKKKSNKGRDKNGGSFGSWRVGK